MSTKKEKVPKIFKALADVASDIEAVSKSKKNAQQGFQYRSIDDIYNMISPLLGKHRVVTVPTMLERKSEPYETQGKQLWNRVTIKMQYDFTADDGSKVTVILEAEGSDSGDKGTNKALSMAHKYALIQLFHIPTADTEDSDATDAAVAAAQAAEIEKAAKNNTAATTAKPAAAPAAPAKLSPADAAKKMQAQAPPPFKRVEPAVSPKHTQLEICDCGAPGAEHTGDGCLIQGCSCGGFDKVCYLSVEEYECDQVGGHIPKELLAKITQGMGGRLPKAVPSTIEQWVAKMKTCKTSAELTAMFNVDLPKEWKKGRLVEEYGRIFNALKAKEKPASFPPGEVRVVQKK